MDFYVCIKVINPPSLPVNAEFFLIYYYSNMKNKIHDEVHCLPSFNTYYKIPATSHQWSV